jgi:hypothetical protein
MPKPISTLDDVVPSNFMQTCSVMFRAGLIGNIPDWYNDLPMGDWPLHILNAEHGKIGYLDEILGVYRVHGGGLWSMNMSQFRRIDDVEDLISTYQTINRHLNFKYDKQIRKKVSPLHYKAALILFDAHRYPEASYYARLYLSNLSFRKRIKDRLMLKVLLKAYFHQLHNLLKQPDKAIK